MAPPSRSSFSFFLHTATTEIYTLSLHDALPIFEVRALLDPGGFHRVGDASHRAEGGVQHDAANAAAFVAGLADRKSTRLNSSHSQISYAVFCSKKKNIHRYHSTHPPENTSCTQR